MLNLNIFHSSVCLQNVLQNFYFIFADDCVVNCCNINSVEVRNRMQILWLENNRKVLVNKWIGHKLQGCILFWTLIIVRVFFINTFFLFVNKFSMNYFSFTNNLVIYRFIHPLQHYIISTKKSPCVYNSNNEDLTICLCTQFN